MKMTKSEAMTVAMNLVDAYLDNMEVNDEQEQKLFAAKEIFTKMKATLDKPRSSDPAAAEKRKAATKEARAKCAAEVMPILRKHLTTDVTVKELTDMAAPELPAGYNWHHVQTFLTREMAPELVRTERKKGGDLYRLRNA